MSLNKSKALRTAEKYVLQGKIPAAIDEYRKVVSADPGDLTTINTLGDLYVRAGRIQDAIANFSRIADSYREGGFTLKAIAMLKKISKLDPTNVETAMKLANLYSQQGLLVEARQQYLQVADAYARAGQTRKALDAYQKIADLDPSNTSVRMKLGEIYSREGLTEQAHDSFIMAGAEFLRKGDNEQALNANLKAIVINTDSRQALTAIATIYTQQGQIERAINILCEAFERNPGDVELLTILGRTYLSAGMMDDAERTFLSLVELDKNRYHYLLEVGRRFLQIGDLDRASEQIDGCIDVLIAKREEDKAIDFLRRVLDRDMNHIGGLKRLAQIFLRIREDHNLLATLNSLVEAAMRKGDDREAIAALKELARLEPDEPLHLQRLYNLGVRDIVEADSPDVVRATGPLDFQSAAYDDTFVIRQISEAEILAGHGQVAHAVDILTEILVHAPENVQVHVKLKDIYLRAGIMDKAAAECLHLARIHESRGESARASDFTSEAHQLNPLIDFTPGEPAVEAGEWAANPVEALGSGSLMEAAPEPAAQLPGNRDSGFEIQDSSGLDWSRYQTGALADSGFVTVPEAVASSGGGSSNDNGGSHQSHSQPANPFRYSDTLIGNTPDTPREGSPVADVVFDTASLLPSDTMPRVLRDELEGIDFYIAQGYVEIARDTLDRLRAENGDHPEILARYKRLGASVDHSFGEAAASEAIEPEVSEPEVGESDVSESEVSESEVSEPEVSELFQPEAESVAMLELPTSVVEETHDELLAPELEVSMGDEEIASSELTEDAFEGSKEAKAEATPFFIQKESGPLYPDLLVQLNTSELLNKTPFDMPPADQPSPSPERPETRMGTGDLLESIASSIDESFDVIHQPDEAVLETAQPSADTLSEQDSYNQSSVAEQTVVVETDETASSVGEQTVVVETSETASSVAEQTVVVETGETAPGFSEPGPAHDELQEIFDELKSQTGDLKPLLDFETHYSLGLAYKDMDLLDDAISEFQMAFRTASLEDNGGDYIHCCNMLGVCFKRKLMPKVAIMWFERGLRIPDRLEDEYQALRFEIGQCHEELGEIEKALEAFMQVYGIDVNYRKVSERIKQLQGTNNA